MTGVFAGPKEMQKRSLIALLLFSVFGFGLLAGPHPCKAPAPQEERASHGACHQSAGSPDGPEAHRGVPSQEDGQDCCDAVCRHACHMTAVAEALAVTFAIGPVSQTVAEVSGSGPPLFAHPIDHIPLG